MLTLTRNIHPSLPTQSATLLKFFNHSSNHFTNLVWLSTCPLYSPFNSFISPLLPPVQPIEPPALPSSLLTLPSFFFHPLCLPLYPLTSHLPTLHTHLTCSSISITPIYLLLTLCPPALATHQLPLAIKLHLCYPSVLLCKPPTLHMYFNYTVTHFTYPL